MKAKLTSHTESSRFVLEVPLDELLAAVLSPEERAMYADCKPDVFYSDNRHRKDGEDDVLVLTFSKEREFKPNHAGLLVEVPKEPLDRCAKESEVEELREQLSALDTRTAGLIRIGG